MPIQLEAFSSDPAKIHHAAWPILQDLLARTGSPSLASLLVTYTVQSGMVPILDAEDPARLQADVRAAREALRSDHFETIRALRGLAQPCRTDLEGLGWRDVFGLDEYFRSERYLGLLAEFPHVCATPEGMQAAPGRAADAV